MAEIQKSDVETRTETEIPSGRPSNYWSKYDSYSLEVDPNQDDRAIELKLCLFDRPHMRSFHLNWWCFFVAFCLWYTIVPLLPEIRKTLNISKKDLWTTQIVGVGGTVFVRFLLGPLNDKFGPRKLFAMVLCACAIPVACVGLVNSYQGLCVLRLFIGLVGGSFVMCQYWTTRMFAREIVGTANAIAAGWGNLGGGAIQTITGYLLFPLFKNVFFDGDAEKAWRTVCIVPAVIGFISGICCYLFTDDAPKGQYHEMKKMGAMAEVSAVASFRQGSTNINTWILFFHYAGCFGVELTINNAAALYFVDQFGQTTENAALIASLFGWLNLFARAMGGYFSDVMNRGMGMQGRIMLQAFVLVGEAGLILIFASTHTLGGSIFVMTILAMFVQAGCGTTYGIVPYVDPRATGTISGIVGAGGNVGAVGFNVAFRQFGYIKAFKFMGWIVFAISTTSWLLIIKGHKGLIFGADTEEVVYNKTKPKTLEVPVKEVNKDEKDDEEVDA